VSPSTQVKPVICGRRSTAPGPVKLATSSATLKLVRFIGSLKSNSTNDSGSSVAALGR
jgi:hypothetical protein